MKQKLLTDLTIDWRTNLRGRRLNLTVRRDGSVLVSVPSQIPRRAAEQFVAAHADWIRRKIAAFSRYQNDVFLPRDRREYLTHKEEARRLVCAAIERHNAVYGFTYHRVSIKDLRRNWGSCSKQGNLNFNYKLIFLPPQLAAYVVVHELCHLGEMNHSKHFWMLVEKAVPEYKNRRKELRRYHA